MFAPFVYRHTSFMIQLFPIAFLLQVLFITNNLLFYHYRLQFLVFLFNIEHEIVFHCCMCRVYLAVKCFGPFYGWRSQFAIIFLFLLQFQMGLYLLKIIDFYKCEESVKSDIRNTYISKYTCIVCMLLLLNKKWLVHYTCMKKVLHFVHRARSYPSARHKIGLLHGVPLRQLLSQLIVKCKY